MSCIIYLWGANVPTLSLIVLSDRVLAVALVRSMMRHFLPCASFRHSLLIWCASSRVGATITARAPFPDSEPTEDTGDPNETMIGSK